MPLVEIIRGEQTSDNTVAKVVAYANKMGKPLLLSMTALASLLTGYFFLILRALTTATRWS